MKWRESPLLARQDSFLTLLYETADAERPTANLIVVTDKQSWLPLLPEQRLVCTSARCDTGDLYHLPIC